MYITSMNQPEAETGFLFDVVIEANLGNFTIPKKEDKTWRKAWVVGLCGLYVWLYWEGHNPSVSPGVTDSSSLLSQTIAVRLCMSWISMTVGNTANDLTMDFFIGRNDSISGPEIAVFKYFPSASVAHSGYMDILTSKS